MIHLAFIDIVQAYTADRPDQDAPFGGTNTAVCFLARALMRVGVKCTFFNRVTKAQTAYDITSMPLDALIEERANPSYSAFIFCGRWVEWLANMVREKTAAPLIAWMHESVFSPGLSPALPVFDGAVFVSEWQARINGEFLQKNWRTAIIRNAMNPAFAGMFEGVSILAAKTTPPILLYAGATPRGVLYLPLLLKHLRERRNDFSVEIYCNCAPTQDVAINAACLEQMRNLPGVTHVGMVGQEELARRMKRASILLSPNPWPETSCITLIEAMAAGLSAVTSNRAALPETASGFARQIEVEDADHRSRFDMPMPLQAFAAAVDDSLNETGVAGFEKKLRTQVDYFNAYYHWTSRAAEWTAYIEGFGGRLGR